jgi:hypothetical protein
MDSELMSSYLLYSRKEIKAPTQDPQKPAAPSANCSGLERKSLSLVWSKSVCIHACMICICMYRDTHAYIFLPSKSGDMDIHRLELSISLGVAAHTYIPPGRLRWRITAQGQHGT